MRMQLTSIFVAAAACVGCAAEPETDTSGTIAVALTSSDPTGAVYRLPDGARLLMAGGTYYDEFSLDGDATFVRISVPPGDYGAELVHDTITGTQWPLTRTLGGVTEVVTATLATAMPAPVTITEDGQTNLVLRFTVPDVGVVTFAEGDLDVTLDVDEVAASQLTFHFEGNLDVTSATLDPSAPPELASLPQVGQLGLYFSIMAHPIGPWAKTSQTSVCAPAAWDSFSAATTALHDVILESAVPDGVLQICVHGGAGVPSTAEVLFYRIGPTVSTGTFAAIPSPESWLFLSSMRVELPSPVFDGQHLDLSPALGAHVGTSNAFTRVAARLAGQTVRTNWHRGFYDGDATLTLTAQ